MPRARANPKTRGIGLALCALVWSLAASALAFDLREVRQNLFGACFASERDGWMVGELGRIFHTADGGATWERQEAGTKRPFFAVSCIDAKTAWIAGKEGTVYGTKDGGASWTLAQTGSPRHVFALAFANGERGHGAGDFGAMIHTEDGGKSWTTDHVSQDFKLPESALDIGVDPGDVNLYGISYADPEHAWMIGEFGMILTSADGGRQWTQQQSPVETTLFGVHFADARRGWAVGIDGVILQTEDGGVTWRHQPGTNQQRSLYDIFLRGNTGWIVGEAGTILKSTDGGSSWALEPLPIELAARWLRSVWVTPGGRGLAVGAEGLVFRLEGSRLDRLAARDREGRS